MPEDDCNDEHQQVARLQSIMLADVVRQKPLPGQSTPVHFPDLPFVTEPPTVVVSEENVATELDTTKLDKPDEIRRRAEESGDQAYIRFWPADVGKNQIRLVLEVKMAPSEPDIQPIGLGPISARFVRSDSGAWKVPDPPTVVAM